MSIIFPREYSVYSALLYVIHTRKTVSELLRLFPFSFFFETYESYITFEAQIVTYNQDTFENKDSAIVTVLVFFQSFLQ